MNDEQEEPKKFWGRLDDFIERCANYFVEITVGLMLLGLLITVGAFLLGVIGVEFDGGLKGGTTVYGPDGKNIVTKQVGFGWAPNWMLTGVVLLPYAVMLALKARLAVPDLISTLINNNMLVTGAFEKPDERTLMELWRQKSRRVLPFVFLVVIVVFGLVVYDFVDVVAQWILASPDQLAAMINDPNDKVTLHHKDYEFDWSIVASFENHTINKWANLLFSGAAYIYMAGFGAAFLFGAFFYFMAFANFFAAHNLRRNGLQLIPNPRSTDKRCGYEEFERFFDPFVQMAVVSSLIALGMYLQNVYLRAVDQTSIFKMIFEPIQNILEKLLDADGEMTLGELANLGVLKNIYELSGFSFGGIPLQVTGSAIALLLITMFVFAYIWWFLRESALDGARNLIARESNPELDSDYSEAEVERVKEIDVWPVSWISVNLLACCIVVVIASIWWPRLVTLFVAYGIYVAIKRVWSAFQPRRLG